MTATSRRRFLQAIMGSSAAGVFTGVLSGCATTAASAVPGAQYATTSLADGLWLVTGGPANVVAARGPDGLLLGGGGLEQDAVQLQRVVLKDCGATRIATLFN